MLDHAPNSDTFQRHYLDRHVCADLWAIYRDRQQQQGLIQQATSHGGSRDSRRAMVFKLTEEHIPDVKKNARYVELTAQLDDKSLSWRSDKREALTRMRKNLLVQLKSKKMREVAREWNKRQDHHDIERQARGEGLGTKDNQPCAPSDTTQGRMFEALTAPLDSKLEAQYLRRTKAIVALVARCGEEEPIRSKVIEDRKAPTPAEFEKFQSFEQQAEEIRKSTLVSVMGLRRCFICVMKACELGEGAGRARMDELCRTLYDKTTLARHFTGFHLDSLRNEGQTFEFPMSHVHLIHKNHLRIHADEVHGINTDRKRKMRYTWV